MTTKVAALVAGAGITLGIIIVVSGPNQKPTAPHAADHDADHDGFAAA